MPLSEVWVSFHCISQKSQLVSSTRLDYCTKFKHIIPGILNA